MRIAVIGDAAKNVRDMLGEWTYFTHPNHHFDETPVPPYSTLFDGLKEVAKETEIGNETKRELLGDYKI